MKRFSFSHGAMFATLLFFLVATMMDIAVLNLCFWTGMVSWEKIPYYHNVWRSLWIVAPLILIMKYQSLVPVVADICFLYGVEDTVFYLVQGIIPAKFTGAFLCSFWEPTWNQVIFLNINGLIISAVFLYILHKGMERKAQTILQRILCRD